jgi:sterol 3beta-glucosyltransferase
VFVNKLFPLLTEQQMRAGTQTLIQALQALPWMNTDNEEDGPFSAYESDDDGRPNGKDLLYLTFLFLKCHT